MVLCMSPLHALVYFVVSETVCGLLLASVFALNHNGMTVMTKEESKSVDYYTRQVRAHTHTPHGPKELCQRHTHTHMRGKARFGAVRPRPRRQLRPLSRSLAQCVHVGLTRGLRLCQIITGRDVTPTMFVAWFAGGLNYQIEHHLFPQLPRHNFHKARHACSQR
jgi:hypothetical protein